MHPYKRRRRDRKDMIVLGGWLFADLLLGLAMLFAVANTVGAPAPTPTPTQPPNYLATSEAEVAQVNVSSQQTVEALQGQISDQQSAAQATEDAQATREAMTSSQRATEDAQATEQAVVARATIEALSTEQAANQSSQLELNSALATNVAQATEVAARLKVQGTEQAALAAVGTENARSGVTAQGTLTALQNQLVENENALATSEAQSSVAQQRVSDAEATSAAAQAQLSRAEQQVQLNSLNPNAVKETIQVDLNGVINRDQSALRDARDELDNVFATYMQGQSCRIGFVNISSRAPDIGQGIQLSDAIADLIESDFPQLLPAATDDGTPQLASESISLPNTTPSGEVELQLFLSSGCEPAG